MNESDLNARVYIPVKEPVETIEAHTDRTLTTSEAAREWDANTREPSRPMVELPGDLEEPFTVAVDAATFDRVVAQADGPRPNRRERRRLAKFARQAAKSRRVS